MKPQNTDFSFVCWRVLYQGPNTPSPLRQKQQTLTKVLNKKNKLLNDIYISVPKAYDTLIKTQKWYCSPN